MGARVQRAFANYMQTFPFFAAAVLMAHVAGRHSWLDGRPARSCLPSGRELVYVPLYAAGIPVARTVAFLVSMVGIVLILVAL